MSRIAVSELLYISFSLLNTARLTDVSQKLNLDELARVAKKYDLHVRVTGLRTVLQGHPASMIH